MGSKEKPTVLSGRALGKQLGWSWAHAAGLLAFSVAVALVTNSTRGKGCGGLPLRRKAPFDLYTDCPEVSEDLQSKKVSELKPGSKGVVYLDARMAHEYCAGHIPGARFMPCYETEPLDKAEVEQLRKLRGRWLVIYGNKKLLSGKRLASGLVNAKLRGVYMLEGGLEAWTKAGRPLKKCVPREISVAELSSVKGKVVYVDARERAQFDSGHIPGAVLFTYDGVLPPEPAAFKKLKGKGDALFVTYAGSAGKKKDEPGEPGSVDQGESSAQPEVDPARGAASELKARGLKRVKILKGGLEAWVQAGRPVEKGANEGAKKSP